MLGVRLSLPCRAADLLPPETPIEQAVDHYVNLKLAAAQCVPAAAVEDAGFLRRVTLDLAGRIPTVSESRAFQQSSEADKRLKLVERLMAAPDLPRHLRNEFDSLLMGDRNDQAFREFLLEAFKANRSWDSLFRALLLGRDDNPAEKPALAFLKVRAQNLDDLTNETSRIFFGVSINCAKCHDHPLVLDWQQDHYFGMASFFNRTYLTKQNYWPRWMPGR